jgi:hypothetical protein
MEAAMAGNDVYQRNDHRSGSIGSGIVASLVVIVLVLLGGLYFVQTDRGTMATGPSQPTTTGQGSGAR